MDRGAEVELLGLQVVILTELDEATLARRSYLVLLICETFCDSQILFARHTSSHRVGTLC